MSACGEQCRDEPCGLACVSVGTHGDHVCQAGHAWDNDADLDRVRRQPSRQPGARTAKQRANEIAVSARRERRVGPPAPGPPATAVAAWGQDRWVGEATAVLREFCAGRTEDFTTPEHVWPLLPTPREMRAMVLPVRQALRLGWMREVGAARLTGTYRTGDGDEFKINKLVPVYRSLLSKDA